MLLRTLIKTFTLLTAIYHANAAAVVTYATCPTLAPLPITNFMPAAMIPIQNTQRAFDIGMNVTIKNAITYASTTNLNAINSSFNTLIENSIKISRSQHEQEMQVEKQFARIKQAYESHLTQQLESAKSLAYPSDPSVAPLKANGAAPGGINTSSPMFKLARNMCNVAKMNDFAHSEASKDKINKSINRRNQKIAASIQAVSNVNMAAKQSIDMHYELFCSQSDFDNGLCDRVSSAPNADINAFNFLYPSGYRGESSEYVTMYTYSPVESLAAYNYIKLLTGTLYMTPPSETERRDGTKVLFATVHKQASAALSMASDVMLEIAQLREPLNKDGVKMSFMDVMAYQIEKNANPETRRIAASATSAGKMLEAQRQIAINNQLRLLMLKQKDAQRRLVASDLALESTIDIMKQNR